MNPTIQKLIDLQALELHLSELRKEIAALPEQLARIEQRVATAREAVEKARQRVLDLKKDRKKLELDVEDWRGKISKYRDQLYQVKTNEAYKALQEEIRNAEAAMVRAEDRLLEEMVGSEDADRDVKRAEAALAETQREADKERDALLQEKTKLEANLASGESAAQELTREIPEDVIVHYHRIARKHSGIALAEAREEACSMCSVRIRPHVMQQLRHLGSDEIIHCETCTRILYYVERPEPPGPKPEASVAEAGNP